jgi:hypothetical protein
MKKSLLILLFTPFLFAGCKKTNDKKPLTHCDNLINENIPASDPGRVVVANAFTPNADGINDQFMPLAYDISSIEVKVYDKNALLVFETTQPNLPWAPAAFNKNQVFYFRVEALTNNNTRIGICGEVNALICMPKDKSNADFYFQDQATPFGFTGVTAENIPNCN